MLGARPGRDQGADDGPDRPNRLCAHPGGGLLPGLGPACDGRVGRRAGRAGVGCRPRRHRASPEAGCGRLLERDGARRGARAALPVPDHHRRGRGPGTARRGGARRAQLRAHRGTRDGRNASVVPDRVPTRGRRSTRRASRTSSSTSSTSAPSPGAATSTASSGRPSSRSRASSATSGSWASTASSRCRSRSTRWTARGATTRRRSSRPSRRTARPPAARTSSTPPTAPGLAVIFDVVYNHFGASDNVLWEYDGYTHEGGIYRRGRPETPVGQRPGLVEARGPGLLPPERPHVPRGVPGRRAPVRRDHPDQRPAPRARRRRAAQRVPRQATSSPSTCPTTRGSSTTAASPPRGAPDAHHETQRALAGQDPVNKIMGSWAGTATTTPGTW